ncbi:ORF6C domain-containing protein [Clostridium sp.]|jgi:anti-repressor protein|uniref:ORF6C domain-containing protein n=1 Tax=Clostridium sp. TaxID=1506 RepID=UPI003EEE39B9
MLNLTIVEDQLVPIYKNDEGQKLVNARELHDFLEIGTQYTKWFERMIEYGFAENNDFMAISQKRLTAQGNETEYIDHVIKLDMAKEISMIQRNEKGKEARKYFIQVENNYKEILIKQLTPMEQIKLQYQTLEEHEQKLNAIDEKVAHLENNMVIEYGQEVSIKKAVNKHVINECGGSEAPAYLLKDLRGKIYRALWRDYKDHFNITSYHNTPKKDFEMALDIVATWKPFWQISREIQTINGQDSSFLSSISTF